MAEGHGRDEWSRASALCCLIANANRGPKQTAWKVKDFNPYAKVSKRKHSVVLTSDSMHLLKDAWFGKKGVKT